MATLVGTWYSNGDLDLPNFTTAQRCAQSVFWNLKAMLTGQVAGPTVGSTGAIPSGALWTMDQCSDSVTVKTDGTDLFGGTFDATKIVRSSGGARSWYVLKSPTGMLDGPWYMLVAHDGVDDQHISIFFGKTRPTGGATNAAPSSADQWGYGSNNYAWTINEIRNLRCNLSIETDGSFWFLLERVGTGTFIFGLSLTELHAARSADTNRVVSCLAYRNDGGILLDPATNGGSLGLPQTALYGIPSTNPMAFKMRTFDNTTSVNGVGLFYGGQTNFNNMPNIAYVYDAHGAGGVPSIGNDGANSIDGTDDLLPQYVAFLDYGKGVKGQPLDVHQGPRRAQGSTNPNTNPTHVNIGGICLPMRHAPNMG